MKTRTPSRAPGLLFAASMLMFFYGFLLGGTQLVIADVAAHYGAGAAGMGLLVAAQNVTAMLAPICVGALADRIGKKAVLIAFCAVFGAGCALAGLSRALGVYVAGAGLIGAGYSVCESLSSAALTDQDPERGMQYINITQCLLSLGAIAGPLSIGACMRGAGADWRLLYLACAAAFLSMVPVLAATRFTRTVNAHGAVRERATPRALLGNPGFVRLLAAIMLYVGLESGFGYFIDSLLDARGGGGLSAFAISAYWAGMALSRFACGLRAYDARKMLRLCFLGSAAMLAALLAAHGFAAAIALSALIGAAYGPVWTTLIAEAARQFPANSAAAVGTMSTGCALSGVLYPAALGAFAQGIAPGAAFAVLVLTAVAGGVLCHRA